MGQLRKLCISFALLVFMSVHKKAESSFPAFFQGTCHEFVICEQDCVNVKGGGHTCQCQEGYELQQDGYSCHKLGSTSFETEMPLKNNPIKKGDKLMQGDQAINNYYGSDVTGFSYSTKVNSENTPKDKDMIMLGNGKNIEPESVKNLLTPTKTPEDKFYHWDLHAEPPKTEELLSLSRKRALDKAGHDVPKTAGPVIYHSCDALTCENGGTCVSDPLRGGYRCRCLLGFSGNFCQKDADSRYPKFKGTGYVAFPVLRKAYKKFTIRLEFRPDTLNGLLLFSGEHPNARADFFSVALVDEGHVEFRFDCGTGMGNIRSRKQVNFGRWNTVTIHRKEGAGWMDVNEQKRIHGKSKGEFSRITLRTDFYLGGYSNMSTIGSRTGIHYGFVGCFKSLNVNDKEFDMRKGTAFVGDAIHGVDIDDCSAHACDNLECQNGGYCSANSPDTATCACPLGFAGQTCTKVVGKVYIPSFSGYSHLRYTGLRRSVLTYTEVEIVFKPRHANGVLFYNGYTTDRRGDFLSLALIDGYVEYMFDLGTGPGVLRSPEPIGINQWHVVRFSRTGREGILQVDNQPKVESLAEGAYTQLTLLLDMYIGGHENFDDTSKKLGITESFQGCIQKVVINDHVIEFLDDAIGGANVDNCEHPCSGAPCRNNGVCMPQKDFYTCSCPLGFENTNCEDTVKQMVQVPMFQGNSFLRYLDVPILRRLAGSKIDIQMRARIIGHDGLIFWYGEELMTGSSDYLALGVVDGYLRLSYNLGSGDVIIPYNGSRLDDGQWHNIRAQRDKQYGYLEIDNTIVVEGQSPGNMKQLNGDGPLYLGGMDDNTVQKTMRKYSQGFTGCISNLKLATDYNIELLTQATDGQNIKECS